MILRMKKKNWNSFAYLLSWGNEEIQSGKIQTNLVSKYRYILNFYVTTFYAGFSHSYKLKEWDFPK